MCNPEPPANSPLAELMLSESRLQSFALDSDRQQVADQFNEFRDLLWRYIEVSNDPNTHLVAWNTIDKFGKAGLAQYQATGNPEALDQIKNSVKAALELL